MRMHRFRLDGLPAMPWKNGGGSTREIACWPAGSGLQDFGWRASIATIAAHGPFSVFPGIDRSITLLAGDGVELDDAAGGIAYRLDVPGEPFAFSGDAHIHCRLLGDTSTDFNVMTRRGLLRAQVRCLREASAVLAAPHGVLYALDGQWTLGDGVCLAPGEGLWWADAAQAWTAKPDAAPARLLAVRIETDEKASV